MQRNYRSVGAEKRGISMGSFDGVDAKFVKAEGRGHMLQSPLFRLHSSYRTVKTGVVSTRSAAVVPQVLLQKAPDHFGIIPRQERTPPWNLVHGKLHVPVLYLTTQIVSMPT